MFQRLKGTVQCKRKDIQGSETRTLQSLVIYCLSNNFVHKLVWAMFIISVYTDITKPDGHTAEPRYKKRFRYTKNDIFHPSNGKIYEKEPRYNDNSLQRTYFASYLALHYICYMEVPLLSSSERLGIWKSVRSAIQQNVWIFVKTLFEIKWEKKRTKIKRPRFPESYVWRIHRLSNP